MHTKLAFFSVCMLPIILSCSSISSNANYKGIAYTDPERAIGQQVIPGRIQMEYYDVGGEGVAFHDTDSMNRGSGGLNKGNTYFDTFRLTEAVDISYTKFRDSIDNSRFNFVQPQEWQFYVGWTEPGEWLKYTVDVQESGTYKLGMMYTCNGDGQIAISVDDVDVTGPISIMSTHVDADPISWRQWHHWNYLDGMAEIELTKGIHTFTLHTVANGQMNYDFISFEPR